MNHTRKGKIARLPKSIREELNRRLTEGELGKTLVAWLNTLPEVQTVLQVQFRGQPISESNLTKWRQGGYRDWCIEGQARAIAQHLGEEVKATYDFMEAHPPLPDALATWMVARYAVETRQAMARQEALPWRLLREMVHDVSVLRRNEHSSQRLDLERDILEFKRTLINPRYPLGRIPDLMAAASRAQAPVSPQNPRQLHQIEPNRSKRFSSGEGRGPGAPIVTDIPFASHPDRVDTASPSKL